MARYKNFAVLTFVSFIWGGTFIFANLIVQEIPPVLGGFLRYLISAVVLLVLLFAGTKTRTPLRREDLLRVLILGASGIFLYNYFFFLGLKYTTPVNGSLIIAVNPAVTTLFSSLYLKEKITVKQALGILISFSGVGLVITGGSWEVLAGLRFNRGDLMLLVCMFSWAVYAIVSKETIRRLSPLETTTYAFTAGALMFVPFALKPLWETGVTGITAGTWAALLYMSLVASVLAFVLFSKALQEVEASYAAIFINLIPLFTMILSVFMGQPVLALQVFGGGLVIFGVAITTNLLFHGRSRPPGEPAGAGVH